MELKKGAIVYSLAGHDKGDFQVIIGIDGKYVTVCDGKYRPLERLKTKNLIHIKLTNTVVDESLLQTNKSIKNLLRKFNEAKAKNSVEKL